MKIAMQQHNLVKLNIFLFCYFFIMAGWMPQAHAGMPMADRESVEATVRKDVSKDLAIPYNPKEGLLERTCLDGRPVNDFEGDLVELWVNLECSYCGIQQPLYAQRSDTDMCIVVRHIPSKQYGDSLKKALSYEALRKFSINGANLFWDKVSPRNNLDIPVPYEASLLLAFQEAAISPEAFSEALTTDAAKIVDQDIAAAQSRISSTPTYVLAGIRFPSCDFEASDLIVALQIAKKAREGDAKAQEQVIKIITNGLLNEAML